MAKTVEKGMVVTIDVTMYDMQNHLLEKTPEGGYSYLHGHDDIFPLIEKALEGKSVGEQVSVTLNPEDAFGEFDPESVFLVDVDKLGDPEVIAPGLVFDEVPGIANDGRHYRVTDVAEGKAVMDANHPLAGWTLRFDVKVLDVEKPDGDKVGSDDVVVPGFLGFADKIIDDEQDDGPDEEAELNRRLGGGA